MPVSEFEVMDVSFIGKLGHNSLTDTTMVMIRRSRPIVSEYIRAEAQSVFLSIAAVYSRERGINHIVTGVTD